MISIVEGKAAEGFDMLMRVRKKNSKKKKKGEGHNLKSCQVEDSGNSFPV